MADATLSRGTGRRKTAIARVRLLAGTGTILVNSRPVDQYFVCEQDRKKVREPLVAAGALDKFDVNASVEGGGPTGQAGAIELGIARALKLHNPVYEPSLRGGHLLTRDSRMKERKKYGKRGARRSVQFSKR
ncbi:MAG TPA: 30S ribosomal protein S9 [Planctomycetota bacterium]|nr:30S ribosomal protein S9 [Planctomycetota bacterium]